MRSDRRILLAVSTLGLCDFGARSADAQPQIFRSSDPAVLLTAARALIHKDTFATFITTDGGGPPRARTVFVGTPDDDLTLWIGTRRGSRKLNQLAENPSATLHFSDDEHGAYLSLMGRATPVVEPELVELKSPYRGDFKARFFPHYPADFVLLRFKPHWMEVMTETLVGNPETWQPEGLPLN